MAQRTTIQLSGGPTSPLIRPFAEFFRLEASGGILLLLSAVVALLLANSVWGPGYFEFWATPFTVGGGTWSLTKPVILWVNDGLMAVFFFVVGLEIKREIIIGELSSLRKAALPMSAAVGGMLIPALIYLALNPHGSTARGWGIPMATDIAFALGILALIGRGAPMAMKVFLTAVAIIDDIGAVLVIALFYTSQISLESLGAAAGVLLVLWVLNRAGVRSPLPYALLGILLWYAILKSGIHATVAGVLLAFFIPCRRAVDETTFLEKARAMLDLFASEGKTPGPMPSATQRDAIHSLEVLSRAAETPLARLEHRLHPWVAFLIVPVFAFANAGVTVEAGTQGLFGDSVMLGVTLGLLVGKPVGVLMFSWLAVRTGVGELPAGVKWIHIAGAAALCGVGFTMSLFIGGLAFQLPENLAHAKVGILLGSAASAILGVFLVRAGRVRPEADRGVSG
jgi:NhaA family Na+:H+ antiporter